MNYYDRESEIYIQKKLILHILQMKVLDEYLKKIDFG